MDELFNRGLSGLDHTVEEALRTLPVAEPPPSLLPGILTRIQPRPVVERPVFRIGWMDFALSLFFAGMIGLAMLLSYQFPPEIRMRLALQMRAFQLLNFDWLLLAALLISGLACIMAAVVFSSSQFNRSAH